MRENNMELSLLVEGFAGELQAAARTGEDQACGLFDSPENSKLPSVGLEAYLLRWAKYTKATPATFTIAAIYIKRVGIILTLKSVHRVAFAALLLACKYLDDHYYTNSFYCTVGGVSLSTANALEQLFLTLVHWDLYVSEDEYVSASGMLQRAAEKIRLSSDSCIPVLSDAQRYISDFDFTSSESETYSETDHELEHDGHGEGIDSKSLFSQSAEKLMSLFGLQKNALRS
eukprot:TRINITY_DN17236_c0_g1_i1.p1 TRINITY_DN17236_c0_g1~~TRINITY_DN17236_c0_g1_i1.p1  ORF type:complete len:230 (+),score=27.32 TRINITY_DN17236_c0_g1_i1:45-734(+)